MAARFLDKLFGRLAALPPEIDAALRDLDRLQNERPALAEPFTVLREIIPLLASDKSSENTPPLTREQAISKLAQALPLLRGETLPFDRAALGGRWQTICAVLRKHPSNHAAEELAAALQSGKLDAEALWRQVLAGKPQTIAQRADALGLDAPLTTLVLRLTLFPILSLLAVKWLPLRDGVEWGRGYCPTCGSWPLLGEYRGLDQTRVLRCGLCASGWECARLYCPFCENRDHETLAYFHVEGEENKQRVATCEKCRGYVKMVSTLFPLTGLQVLCFDVATLHLDLAAAERGYVPP